MALNLGELYGTVGLDTGPLSSGFDKAKSMLASWGDSMKKKADEDGKESGSKWTSGWRGAALIGAASAGIAVAGVIAGAVVRGMNLEPARDKMQAQLGLTEEQASRIGKAAGKAYSNNFGESLEQVTEAAGIVVSSMKGMRNASEAEIQSMTEKVLTLSEVFDIDVSRAAQVAGQMVKSGFAKDGEEAIDLLTASLQKVPAAVREDVMDAVDEYGPFFKGIGIQGQQAMELLVKASEKGMFGIDKTGDALKEFTIRATDMSKTSGAAYKTLGLDQEKMTAALLKGGDDARGAFDKIIGGLNDMKDPTAQSQAALALFGTPLEDLNTKDIPKFLKGLTSASGSLDGFKGSTQDAANVMGGNAQANINSFIRRLEVFAVETIGNKVLPVVNDFTKWFSDNLEPALKTGVDNLEGFGKWVQQNTSWLLPLAAALGVVALSLKGVALAQTIMAAGGFLQWIMNITKATQIWSGVQAALNLVMSLNPIGLIVIAIGALVAAFIVAYNSSEDFRNIVNAALSAVGDAGKKVLDWFTGPFAKFWVDLWDTVSKAVTDFGSAAKRVWDDITGWIGKKVDEIAKGVKGGFDNAKRWATEALGGLASGAKGIWDGYNAYQQRWNEAYGKLLRGDFKGFAKDVEGIWNDLTKGLTKAWDGFRKGVADIWDKLPADIKAPIRSAVNWINDTFIGGVNGMLSKLSIGWRIPQIPGFTEGGYTGNGGKHDVAGVVHRGEVVWSQEDVDAHGGPRKVDALRRSRGAGIPSQETGDIDDGFARGGIVPNARQGFRGYNAAFLSRIKAWAAATGRTWHMTGNGGARSYADQLRAWNLYKAGKGPLAADPRKGGPHMIPSNAMDLSPRPGQVPAARAMLGAFGLGLPVGGEPWHVGWARGGRRGGGAVGGGSFDFGLGDLVKNLLGKLNVAEPWDSVVTTAIKKTPDAIMKKIFGSFAMGTDYAPAGIASVAENGAELVLGKSLRAFRGGEKVLTASQTSRALGSGVTPEDIRRALEGLRVDIANGRLFFDREMGRYESKLDFDSRLVGAGGGI